mgnify:FL=1
MEKKNMADSIGIDDSHPTEWRARYADPRLNRWDNLQGVVFATTSDILRAFGEPNIEEGALRNPFGTYAPQWSLWLSNGKQYFSARMVNPGARLFESAADSIAAWYIYGLLEEHPVLGERAPIHEGIRRILEDDLRERINRL